MTAATLCMAAGLYAVRGALSPGSAIPLAGSARSVSAAGLSPAARFEDAPSSADPEAAVRTITELSHTIRDGMVAYPGLPRPQVGLHLDHATSRPRYDGQAEFAIGRLELVGNTGTYLDSPYHRYPDGDDVSAIPLDRLVDLPTTVIDATVAAARGRWLELDLPDTTLTGRAVLIRTGWDERWGTDAYWRPGPYLGPAMVQQLLEVEPALVGVDCWNVDDTDDPARPVHTALLGAGIPIVEHLRDLGAVGARARTFVVPLAVVGAPCLPVRAFAIDDPSVP